MRTSAKIIAGERAEVILRPTSRTVSNRSASERVGGCVVADVLRRLPAETTISRSAASAVGDLFVGVRASQLAPQLAVDQQRLGVLVLGALALGDRQALLRSSGRRVGSCPAGRECGRIRAARGEDRSGSGAPRARRGGRRTRHAPAAECDSRTSVRSGSRPGGAERWPARPGWARHRRSSSPSRLLSLAALARNASTACSCWPAAVNWTPWASRTWALAWASRPLASRPPA